MSFVVDNSVVMGWFFATQSNEYTGRVLDRLETEIGHVPALWVLEFSNVVRKALTSGKISQRRADEILSLADGLKLVVDYSAIAPSENLALAVRFGLSSYDAAYLDLAIRLGLPLATRDEALKQAAIKANVSLLE